MSSLPPLDDLPRQPAPPSDEELARFVTATVAPGWSPLFKLAVLVELAVIIVLQLVHMLG